MIVGVFTRVVAVVVLVALRFGATPAVAQNLRAGVKFGIDFANLAGDVEDTKVRSGYSVGAFFGADLAAAIGLGIDAQYVEKGAKLNASDIDDLTIDLGYAELLLPLSLTVPTRGSVRPRFFAGPTLAVETSCSLAATVEGIEVTRDCADQDIGLETKSIDFGVFFGLGADVTLGSGVMTFDGLYNLGVSDINDVAGAEDSFKNRNIQITIGYALLFGGS